MTCGRCGDEKAALRRGGREAILSTFACLFIYAGFSANERLFIPPRHMHSSHLRPDPLWDALFLYISNDSMDKTAGCASLGSFVPRQTLQHLSVRTICSDSAHSSSGHGSLGTSRCMVLSCDEQKDEAQELHHRPPSSSAKSLQVITKVIIHLFSFLSSFQSPRVFITNKLLIHHRMALLKLFSQWQKNKIKSVIFSFPPAAVFCDSS